MQPLTLLAVGAAALSAGVGSEPVAATPRDCGDLVGADARAGRHRIRLAADVSLTPHSPEAP
jgi:hypothetical protein